MEGLVRIALRTARQQAPQLIQAHDRPPVSRFSPKGLQEYVHQLRTRMTSAFHEMVHSQFPEHQIARDSTNLSKQSGYCWFIEPLCGEENFLRSMSDYCAVIGVFHNGVSQHIVIYHYLDDSEYYATKDEGAVVNKVRLRVSSASSLTRAVVAYAQQDTTSNSSNYQVKVDTLVRSLRRSGCVALDFARVAQGKLDACVSVGTNQIIPSAASLLVSEAGGFSRANLNDEISIAGNPQIFDGLKSKLID
ncbi:MAG: hypothetical protein F4Z14_06375 [Gammaproteobacteria bacterium]|nr:hypothetical protein [Gammaproteobacteria bacterium]